MLGIITIDYKNPQMTIDFIKRELPNIDIPYKCVIVVNGSTDDEVSLIKNKTNGVVISNETPSDNDSLFIIPSKENLGFAKGNNLGVQFLQKNFNCDYLLFTNTDIEIKSKNIISKMIACLEGDKERGAIGPMVLSRDRSIQLPHYKPISPYRQMGWNLLSFLRKKGNTPTRISPINPQEGFCYWVQGSFFIMRTSDFMEIDMFDPNTFLYGEEPILAEKLKRIHKRMYFYPKVSILHYEGGTILKKNTNYRSLYMAMQSNCYYYRKYLGYNPLIILLYRWSFIIHQKFFKK